jgi:hypothetical protein
MNTIKTILSLSLLTIGGAAQATDINQQYAAIETTTKAVQQTAIDTSDNRGMTLLFDDQVQPGRIVVSGISKLARQAGVETGDVVTSICTKPANLKHYGELAGLVGKNDVYMVVGGHNVKGNIPAAAVKVEKNRVVVNKAMTFDGVATAAVVGVPAGAEVYEVCVPVHTGEEAVSVIAPFTQRITPDGFLVQGGHYPMTYHIEHNGIPAVITALPNWNPSQLAKQASGRAKT